MTASAREIPNYVKLVCASAAGVSGTLVCFPLDVLRLNMQVAGEFGAKREQVTTYQFARAIVTRDGFRGLYQGISASVARQALYTGTRLGLFQIFSDMISKEHRGGEPITFLQKCMCGMVAGTIGACIGLPPDVALTRMAVDNRLPANERRNYQNVFHAFYRMYQDEGFLTLYRGTVPTIFRAVIVNVSQLVSYFQAKELLIKYQIVGDNNLCQVVASVISSFVATTATLPADIAKTRIQNMQIVDGVPQYKNMLDVWFKVITHEGFFALWKGFTPLFFRNAPQFVVTFIAYEKFIELYNTLRKQ